MANILILGDEHTLSRRQREVLQRQHCQIVEVVASPQAAIALLASVDLVLVDLSPHLASPLERLAQIEDWHLNPSLPLVLVTPTPDNRVLQRAIAASPAGFLLKPIRTAELQATIHIALTQAQPPRHGQASASASPSLSCLPWLASPSQTVAPVDSSYQQMQRLNVALEEQIQHRTAQLRQAFHFEAILKRITDRLRDSLNEKQILQTAVRELVLAIGVRACNAALYDTEHQAATVCHEFNTTHTPFHSYTLPMSSFPEGYRHLLTGEYFQCCDLHTNPDHRTAKLVCPIVGSQGVLGDLCLTHDADYGFTDPDIRLVELVANQCAIALRQARLFQATQIQIQELERLHRLKDDFLSTISHELRTPMANIKMAITMLGMMGESTQAIASNPRQRYFNILQSECQREIELIDNLLDLSELTANPVPFMPTPVDVEDCVRRRVAAYRERASQAQRTLECHVPGPVPLLLTDAHCLARILNELLNNACKYTPPQERIVVSVAVVTPGPSHPTLPSSGQGEAPGNALVEIKVMNTGVEIPPEERSRIFEKFYRIPQADPWRYSGTGLGLAIVKKLVTHIQATIDVCSDSQHTAFILRLPYFTLPPLPTEAPAE